ncbi:DHH family phosphoesterase [Galbibacter pacificus]|uniref:Bifunctional oligoribonuclease/PAP phosphatase NrnA n=1 Tax=Galbibacter pacificus TaxID=2996052 RepID=A0ABT6FNH4_9FLAO|nr:bifunctional oligoribonuclease/PAP phosphatase NrnA [Galbibacter pacificus]MDG3581335.1 bifunctional oligoribonuclease/PAP phosphatase NrnA [Galbibacter pacificus]MDG3584813.1 bifunctional oligoribonuclease/PAP phosphatase NrnA [Galbibacter pacificus]
MEKSKIKELKKVLSSPKKIVVIPHKNPDGDAIGSSLGVYHYLKQNKHDISIISPNDYPDFLKWMPGEEVVIKYDAQNDIACKKIKEAELIFTLDFNSLSRIDEVANGLKAFTGDYVMIDHHQAPDDYAKYTYSDTSMSSTCEMVYNFIDFLGEAHKITAEIATCLYTGIMTDTGSFRFPSTTSATHRIIANLIDYGAKNALIHNDIFDTNSLDKLHLLGCALKNLVELPQYHTVYITLSKEELQQFNYKKGDTEGFVNYGLSLKGIKFAAIFIESAQENIIKISLRSKGDFSVNEFARKHFNGGGHINAAGGRSEMSLEETTAFFEKTLKAYKEELQ